MAMAMETATATATAMAMGSDRVRSERGHTLLELTISMAVSAILLVGFTQAYGGMTRGIQSELQLGVYGDNVRLAFQQVARDLRLAGSNPSADPLLFDGDPSTDVAVDLDPDKNGNITDAILIRSNRSEAATTAESTSQTLETIMIHYDRASSRLYRHAWYSIPNEPGTEVSSHNSNRATYDTTPILENVCSCSFQYLTTDEVVTTDPALVANVDLTVQTAAGAKGCSDNGSFLRSSYARIRIRNR